MKISIRIKPRKAGLQGIDVVVDKHELLLAASEHNNKRSGPAWLGLGHAISIYAKL
jgi:hypothetical protein